MLKDHTKSQRDRQTENMNNEITIKLKTELYQQKSSPKTIEQVLKD